MFLELHILQNFAPSNLNRDDTGSPKDCEFGDVRRARISSQCLKRAIRTEFKEHGLLDPASLSQRTKRLHEEITRRLVAAGRDAEPAAAVAERALSAVGLAVVERGLTQYLVFLGEREIEGFVQGCQEHWDALTAAATVKAEQDKAKGKGEHGEPSQTSPGKAKGKAKNDSLPTEVQKAFRDALDGGKAADLALFGRMLANLPERNVDAACQVAHALSTHRVAVDFDYYTAVDDLRPTDTQGADMIGTVEFNSACYYRYANVDLVQLAENLQGDEGLARAALKAFLRASIDAVPTGKQNSMAAHNPPSLVFAVLRERGLWSLANAFVKPVSVRASAEKDLVAGSASALARYWSQLVDMYGDDGIAVAAVAALGEVPLDSLGARRTGTVAQVIDQVLAEARFGAARPLAAA